MLFGAQETNSYVGPCNRLAFNVGLHNENNDFTGVPWHRLPELRRPGQRVLRRPAGGALLPGVVLALRHGPDAVDRQPHGPIQPRRLAMSLPLTLPAVAPCRLSDG